MSCEKLHTNVEKGKRLYAAALDISKALDEIYKSADTIEKLFTMSCSAMREKLKSSCEMLIIHYPLQYGKKAEEILWRGVFYDLIQIIKQKRHVMLSSKNCECLYRTHISSAFGYYNQLISRMLSEYKCGIKMDGIFSFSVEPCFGDSICVDDEALNLYDYALKALHRCLLYLGDLGRYQLDFEAKPNFGIPYRYYKLALLFLPELGMPLNQLGTLFTNKSYGFYSAYYYLYCMNCASSFEGAKDNLKMIFESNRLRFKELKPLPTLNDEDDESSFISHRSKEIRFFIVRFLYILDNLLNSNNISNLQIIAEKTINDFNTLLFYKSSQNISEKLIHLSDDRVFKIVAMSLLVVERINKTEKKSSKGPMLSSALTFAVGLFSHVVNHIIIRLQNKFYDIRSSTQQALQKLTHLSESDDEDEESCKDSVLVKKRLKKYLNRRRRQKYSRESDGESIKSDDNSSYNDSSADLSEGPLPTDWLHEIGHFSDSSSLSSSESSHNKSNNADDTEGRYIRVAVNNFISKMETSDVGFNECFNFPSFKDFSEKLTSAFSQYDTNISESNGHDPYKEIFVGKKQVKVALDSEHNQEAKDAEELDRNLANFDIETDTDVLLGTDIDTANEPEANLPYQNGRMTDDYNEITGMHTTKIIVEMLEKETLLPCIKIFFDWLLCNKKCIHCLSQFPQPLWSRIALLLNFLPHESELVKSGLCQSKKVLNLLTQSTTTKYWNIIPLSEDIEMCAFDALKQEHANLKFEIGYTKRLSKIDETILRICCLRRFGYLMLNLSLLAYDKGRNFFTSTLLSNKETSNGNDSDSPKKMMLMKTMAKLRLEAEVNQLQGSKTFPPILVPDLSVFMEDLKLLLDLSKTNRFVIIVPYCVIDQLDQLKKYHKTARESSRWLERRFNHGDRFVRTQAFFESSPSKKTSLKRKDKEMWNFHQALNCCRYFVTSNEVHCEKSDLVSLLISEKMYDSSNPRISSACSDAAEEGINIQPITVFHKNVMNSADR